MQRENDVGVYLLGSQYSETSKLGNLIAGMPVFPQTTTAQQEDNIHHTLQQNRVVSLAKGLDIKDAQQRASNCCQFVRSVKNFIDNMGALNRFIIFVLVLQFGCRTSEEDMAMIEFFVAVLGESLLECHTLIAMTGGDLFEREHGNWRENFLPWCQNQHNGYLRNLMEKCRWRVHLFGDTRRDEVGQGEQLQHLFISIDNTKQELGDRAYSSRLFKQAADSRTRAVVNARKWVVEGETNNKCDWILAQLRRIRSKMCPAEQLQHLDVLKTESSNLVDVVNREDCGTRVMTLLISRAELANRSVCDAIDVCKNDIQSECRMEATENHVQQLVNRQARITNLLLFLCGIVFFLYCDQHKWPKPLNGHGLVLKCVWVVIFLVCWLRRVKFSIHLIALIVAMMTYWVHEGMPCLRIFF